jgi:HK97 family phage portal protein
MTQTPIPPGIIRRATAAARYVLSGVSPQEWFGPLQPLPPMAPPDVAGRRFDYPTGYNLTSLPRSYEAVTFEELRALADNCDILRSVIETRKDQMEALDWAVRVTPSLSTTAYGLPNDDQKRRIAQVTAFLNCPDKERSFAQWLRQILEDMFVIDAATLYKRTTASGELYALEILDGATIKILIDDSGRLPCAPDPAYQQVLKGVPAADYTRDELMYLMHNPRSHKIYGYSHVEQVLVTINILIRRAQHQLEFYREGSQPDALIGLPKEWSQEQINTFQKSFDAMYSGNLAQRRRARFMPGEFKYQETKPPPLKDAYDEFLARIVCYVFSISPEPFVGQVNRATAQTSHARAIDEGLNPLMRFVSGFMNRIIAQEFASPDLEFVWQDSREQDPAEAAQIDVAYVSAGILTVDEVRQNMGLLPLAQVTHPLAGAGMVAANVKKNSGLRPLRAHIRKFNPYHLRPGPAGGQFTTAGMDGTSNGLPPGSGTPARSDLTPSSRAGARGTQVAGNNAVPILGGPKTPSEELDDEMGTNSAEKEALEQEEREIGPMLGVAISSAIDPTPATAPTVEDLLMPEGQRLGQAGTSGTIREVQGTAQDAQTFFDQLTQGGTLLPDSSYTGVRMNLSNGGTASIRNISAASPNTAATIDVEIPNIPIKKIKFNP